MKPLDSPLNAQEKYLYGINERLDVLINLLQKDTTSVDKKVQENVVKVSVQEEVVLPRQDNKKKVKQGESKRPS